MKCQIIMDALERIAPKTLAEDWDNPGLLVGAYNQEINKIMVCLDVSDSVIAKAVIENVDMIISHHPLLFKAIKNIRTDLPLGRQLQQLLKHDIAVAAAHTNLDIAEGGVNDVLAAAIGLEKLAAFVITRQTAEGKIASLGRIGRLSEAMTAADFAVHIKNVLPTDYVRLVEAGSRRPVRKVVICSGSGAEFIERAAFMGADAYVTGDVKYHDAQRAKELGIHVIDAGHFGTEYPVVKALQQRLAEELAQAKGQVTIIADETAKDFFEVIK